MSIISTALVVVMVALAILLVGVRVVGLTPYTVLSGSMVPAYPVGSLIYVREIDAADIEVGTPLTFHVSGGAMVATHRVHEIITENGEMLYITKGDANDNPDASLVGPAQIIGRVSFGIPHLGNIANYIQNPPGMYVAIAAGAILILLVFLPDLIAKKKKEGEGTDAPAADVQPALTAAEEENERLRAELERLRAEMAAPEAPADSADADTAPDAE